MKKLLPVFLVLLLSFAALGQEGSKIIGTVTDQFDTPLPTANVRVPSLNIGGATDVDGKYSISIPAEYVTGEEVEVVASYVGYKSQTKTVVLAGRTIEVNFSLAVDVFESEDVVVTGIASKTSKAITEVAVARVKADQYTEANGYQTLSQLVTGKIAGVQLQPTSGNVGGGFRFFMRGGGGLNGDEQPVVYVDGVRVDNSEVEGWGVGGQGNSMLASLNPDDIENIEVLKGPAAAATYGTSGSNGVVLITTKTGSRYQTGTGAGAENISIQYKNIYGYNTQWHKYSTDYIKSADAANKIYRDGIIRQNSLSASGGINILRYYASIDNRFEEGIIPNNHMDRTSLRANISAFPSEKLTLRFKAGYTNMEVARPNNDNNIYGFLGNTILAATPYYFLDSLSVMGLRDINKSNQFTGSTNITYSPIKNLEINATAGLDNSDYTQDMTFPYNLNYATVNDGERLKFIRSNKQYTYDINARYNYSLMKNLQVSSVVGAQLFNEYRTTFFLDVEKFNTELITDIGAGEDVLSKGETSYNAKQTGIFTEHSLAYMNQYFFTFAVREDFASAIGTDAPSIIYPKVSGAVRMDRYDFFPDMFSLFKLRAAYGESGQLPLLRDPIPLLWEAESGGYGAGAVLSDIGNNEIKPERIKELEIGLDMELFNRISLEFTYYRQNAENSIVGYENSPSTGLTASNTPYNIGAMHNSGFESLLQLTPWYTSGYRLDLSLIWNYQQNKVDSLGQAQPIYDGFDVNVIKDDLPKHEFYTREVKGALFNEDGTYAGEDVTADPVALGNPIPSHTGSFTVNFTFLHNFNLYVLTDWAIGQKIFNFTRIYQTYYGNNVEFNKLEDQLFGDNALTPGTQAYRDAANQYAKLTPYYDGNYIEDADYFKIREISLSYNFRDIIPLISAGSYISDFIIGISARNLLTITNYDGTDPELNFDGGRSLSRGIDFLTLQNPRTYNLFIRLGI